MSKSKTTDHTLKLIQRHLARVHPKYAVTRYLRVRSKHKKYHILHSELPIKRTLIASKTPSDGRANKNLIAHLNKAVREMEQELAGNELEAELDQW